MPFDAGSPPLVVTLAWRNLWRHARRTLMILFAFALGVWSMVVIAAISRGSMEQQLDKAILTLTGHIQLHAPGYRDDPAIEYRLAPPDALLRAALAGREVSAWASRVRVPAVIASERESAGVTLVGIDPAGERGLSFIPAAVTAGRYLESPDDQGLVLGRKLAERLETGLGRRVVLMSQDVNNQLGDRGFRVVGLFDTQPRQAEEAYVFIGRATAQQMLKLNDAVTEIAVMIRDRDRPEATLDRLRAAAPGLDIEPWTVIEPLLVLTQKITDVILIIWYAIVFAAMSFGLINTLLMAVFERTREFGLFQALGMPPRHILGQVLVESLILLLLALLLGNLAAWATIASLKGGIDLSAVAEGMELVGIAPVIYPAWAPADMLAANALVFVLGIAASLYPAWRAARHVPVEAITRV
ncbi:MAG: ABC transporter permease [Gammaproteobacteria bacterium]|nr:ABC transporter permease [Gammaproteobacteria bacterium]